MVPKIKWFLKANGSSKQMVPKSKWFPRANGSSEQMVLFFKNCIPSDSAKLSIVNPFIKYIIYSYNVL